jgi:Cof subfamily protein (haloacid dehalogenase superfamily)
VLRDLSIRLVGIDVDGTLVGAGGLIHPRVWDVAQRAHQSGIHLTLCSGRPAFGLALDYARRLDANGWHAFQNGASVLNLGTGTSRSVAIPSAWTSKLIGQARSTGEALELYGDTEYVEESTSDWTREHAELLGVHYQPRPFESLRQPIVRAQWLLSPERAREFTSVPHPGLEVAQSGSPLMPDTQFVGLTREGVTKGSAIRSIAEEYGVPLRDVMYVGDSGNDLSALQIVGHPVAMGNADPAVLAVARHVVGHVDDGGLAEALEMALRP